MSETLSPAERNWIALATTGAGVGVVTVWGVLNWDYFTQSPKCGSEGWFGEDTEAGGLDKLGHLYTGYVLSHGISYLYEYWNFERNDAAWYGSLTTFAILGYMEVGDSFSEYGFSHEDMVMNMAGCVAAYLLYTNPRLAEKIDLRWQFGLHPTQWDFSTDYENSKFLLALKLNGFESMRQTFLRHVELLVGYSTEGFEDHETSKSRNIFVGVGFNLTDLFRRNGYKKTATAFKYLQFPFTSVGYDFEL